MKRIITIGLLLSLVSCNRIANKTKEGINKGGEVVGESATEFFEGVSEGVDKTLECKIILSKTLGEKGINTGVYDIGSQSNSNDNNNKLTLYIIFKEDFSGELFAKAFNKSELEIGRTSIIINAEKGTAGYFDFKFDERTDIGFRNKIILE